MSRPDPRSEYAERLNARRRTVARYEQLDVRIAQLRGGLVAAFLAAAALSLWLGWISAWWLLLPPLAFLPAAVAHARILRDKSRAAAAVTFYEDGLARIDDRWIGRGNADTRFADDAHPYAIDLDLFGQGSLFELLCTARTAAGQATLARWLKEPASPTEIVARQNAIEDLRERLGLREDIQTNIGSVESVESVGQRQRESQGQSQRLRERQPSDLLTWSSAPPAFNARAVRLMAAVSSGLTFAAVAAVVATGANAAWLAFYLAVGITGLIALTYRERVHGVLAAAGRHREELRALAGLLRRVQAEGLTSKKIVELQSALTSARLSPDQQFATLDRLLGLVEVKKNDLLAALLFAWFWQVFLLPLSYLLWTTQIAAAVERWRAAHGHTVPLWADIAGELDALCALSGYAYEHPADPFPDIADTGPLFDGEDLCHPLIPAADCVANTLRLGLDTRALIVSGSNMSGKSTLLRTAGINAVLALAGAPVRASRLRLSPLAIGATLRIHDSIHAGTSRFQAEIERIRMVVATAERGAPHVLFLFDELLHGTNSHDRKIGAEAILRALLDADAIGLVTTHDLAIAEIAGELSPRVENVHFRDELRNGAMFFDYQMHPGPAQKSNALALMAAVGLDVRARARPSTA